MARDIIHLEWEGVREFDHLLSGLERELEAVALEEYTKFGKLAEEGTKALAPLDSGDLEAGINFSRAKKSGSAIVVEGGVNSEYGLRRHEAPYKNGVRPKYDNGAKFPGYYANGRGARTRSKAGWRGMKAGRKYMTRTIEAIKSDFERMNERILRRTLERRGGR